jgi:phosphoribosyl-ATP pyrophosphohydrolase
MTRNVDDLIDYWFDDRGISKNGKPMGQAIKTLEETTELLDALNKDDKVEVMDAIGDIYVTLRGVCRTYGVNMDMCIEQAYNEIKDRTGHLGEDGVFVKD